MSKPELKPVNVDLPGWMVDQLDKEAKRLGINRKAMINVLLADALRRQQMATAEKAEDQVYLKAAEASFSAEWDSAEDEEAFHDL
jgi:hypothetical protein